MHKNSAKQSCYNLFAINKTKLIWQGNTPQLKAFVATEVNQRNAKNAIWRSPGVGTWCFKDDDDLSVTCYSKRKTISFDSKAADRIKKQIYEVINNEHTAPFPTVQRLYGTEENEAGCGDCYKLAIEMAEVKLEVGKQLCFLHL